MSWIEAPARWYAVVALITWAFAPAIWWLFPWVPDRGTSLARPLAMLFAIYPAWLLAAIGVTSFGATRVWMAIVLGGLAGWALALRGRAIDRDRIRDLVVAETASALLFAAYLWQRGFHPQILGTEKPMDLAFLASSARATVIPPPDPWFAGEPINYYYLGYLLHGTTARLANIPPETAFNLALASIFSMTLVAAFGVAWGVLRPWLGSRAAVGGGVLAAFLLALAGNTYAAQRLMADAEGTVSAWWWDSVAGIGWRSSRIVCDGPRIENRCPFPATETINEFPFFSFLLGDLHPHLMALPYTVVAIGLAWNLASHARDASDASGPFWFARIVISGAVVGALYPLNAWDYPTYLIVTALGVWIGSGPALSGAWRSLLTFMAVSVLTWLPYYATYIPPITEAPSDLPALARLPVVSKLAATVSPHLGERTSLAEYLTIFAAPYAFGVVFVLATAFGQTEFPRERMWRTLIGASVVTLVLATLLSAPVVVLCGIPLALAVDILRLSPRVRVGPRLFVLALFCAAWTLSIAVELIYIRDAFADRMNTLFKFYYQTWTLYALAAAVTIPVLWYAAARRPAPRVGLAVAVGAAVLVGSLYPVIASYQWTNHFERWVGLDGLAYAEATDPDDLAAARWLRQHAAPGDVVLEAAGCSYRPFDRLPFNRVAALSGVPAVIGWGDNHQRQWRAGEPARLAEIDEREAAVAAMYDDPQSALFDRYDVTWLFVGEYETGDWRQECETAGPYAGIDAPGYPGEGWQEVFASGKTRIYRRQAS